MITEQTKNRLQFEMEAAIGCEIANLLNMKFDKSGRTKTAWGSKTIVGIGASILRIVEEEKERFDDKMEAAAKLQCE